MVTRKATKTKAAALTVPQNDDEANALLVQYGEAFNIVGRVKATMNDKLAEVKAEYEEQAAPWTARMQQIFEAMNAYAGANRQRLTSGGKTKTVEFPAGAFGWRLNPPSVRLKRGFTWDAIAEWLHANGMRRFIRVKHEVNKEAILADAEHARVIEGIAIGTIGEQFFLAPFGAELSEPKP